MRKQITALILTATLLFPGAASCGTVGAGEARPLGVYTEADMTADSITSTRSKTLGVTEIFYDGCSVPYEKSAAQFYLPLSADGIASGELEKLSAEGLDIYIEALPEPTGFAEAVKSGTKYRIIVYNDTEYGEYSLVFTSFPVMTIELADEPKNAKDPIPETDVEASMFLFDPGTHTDGNAVTVSTDALLRVRGGTSRVFEKKSYKVQLVDAVGNKRHEQFLDLRLDDDWILYAMYQEETKMRDRIAMDLWQEMSAGYVETEVAGISRIRYIEVILNGKYWGMYGLMERIDAKQLGLPDNQPLGKISAIYGNKMPTVKEIQSAVKKNSEYAQAVELKNPDIDSPDYATAWTKLGEFINFAYYSDDKSFAADVDKYINSEYFLLYWIYAQFECMGQFKNPYIWQGGDGKYYITPWDFDISLGLNWDGNAPLYHVRDKTTITRNNQHIIGQRLLENHIGDSVEVVKSLYKELRSGLLSLESLNSRTEELYTMIHDSGAYDRNLKRWPKTGSTPDNGREGVEYLQNYFKQRLEFLDGLIDSLK